MRIKNKYYIYQKLIMYKPFPLIANKVILLKHLAVIISSKLYLILPIVSPKLIYAI